ncbi:N-alpha-acetyltransferase 80 [Hippopotamus amphibius kiboko]|uniref:N-alpha-acetyltransferase 80 n=1 Tax=Hippopotamus amphibius kiboko TaxID=575201 RepID=UPI002592DFCC|nr:N-alpha-acetyltransferase 80 [Hippopotamus amphibius kiboko]
MLSGRGVWGGARRDEKEAEPTRDGAGARSELTGSGAWISKGARGRGRARAETQPVSGRCCDARGRGRGLAARKTRDRVVGRGPCGCSASAATLGGERRGGGGVRAGDSKIRIQAERGRGASRRPASTYPIHQVELILSTSPAQLTLDPARQAEVTLRSNLAKLILDPTHQPELTLSPRLAELTLGSACHAEMTLSPGLTELTLDPAHQPEKTPAPNLAELTLEPVHCRPELLDACADLINEQWPRSRASRLHSLAQSSDAFPLCLMLLSPHPTPEAAPIVVGHARLSRVLDRPQSLLVETVVVARAMRGRGFGRCLMEGLEAFAQARGFRRLHLTTHDQLHFYAHLGYQLGEPVQGLVFTSHLLPATLLKAFPRAPFLQPPCKAPSCPKSPRRVPRAPKGSSLPPPPPLPEPLTTLPPPPAGARPHSLRETQYQDLRGRPIFWMEKDI